VYSKKPDGSWSYDFTAKSQVTDLAGVGGQNTANPVANFTAHFVAVVDGVWYDVSYGNKYQGTQNHADWETASVDGLVKEDLLAGGAWFIAKSSPGVDTEAKSKPYNGKVEII
jgi:hypothetical protein